MVQILAGLFIAVFIQLAATCCAPVKMQGFQGVSSGLMVNGIGISAQVCKQSEYQNIIKINDLTSVGQSIMDDVDLLSYSITLRCNSFFYFQNI